MPTIRQMYEEDMEKWQAYCAKARIKPWHDCPPYPPEPDDYEGDEDGIYRPEDE